MNVFEKGDVIGYHIRVWLMLTINNRFEKSKNNPSLHSRETVCNFVREIFVPFSHLFLHPDLHGVLRNMRWYHSLLKIINNNKTKNDIFLIVSFSKKD